MAHTVDIGRRIELVPMDPHFRHISIALYRRQRESGPAYRVHTYSCFDGARERIEFVAEAMRILGGMESTPEGLLHFPCRAAHEQALKRLFLESCKLVPGSELEARPLHIFDKKAGCEMVLSSLGGGLYQVAAEEENAGRRAVALARGLVKLGEMEAVEGRENRVVQPCGRAHDALVGLLLGRALNVRSALREQETSAARGVLAAPGSRE